MADLTQVYRLITELFTKNTFVKIMVWIKQQRQCDRRILGDVNFNRVTDLEMIGDGGDRSFFTFKNTHHDARPVRQQRAAPAPRAEGVERGQGKKG